MGAPARGLNPALPFAAPDKLQLGHGISLFYCVHGGQSRDQDCKKVIAAAPTDGITEKIDFFLWQWYIVTDCMTTESSFF